jgi:hypothetical protein
MIQDTSVGQKGGNRGREVLQKLRLDHLNEEEKGVLENTCLDFQDIFHLTGEKLTATNAARHSVTVVPGTAPIGSLKHRKQK